MGEDRLHVVFGTGQVGRALADHLAGLGLAVRTVSRRRPTELSNGIDWRSADAADPDAASDAAEGAAVVYQCLNAPYTQSQGRCSRRCSAVCWPPPSAAARCW